MKRYILMMGALLLGCSLWAQSVTYTCRYWFDQNHSDIALTTFSEGTLQAELDVDELTAGLHTLHLQIMDTALVWNSSKTFMFYKTENASENLRYHCWFDQDISTLQSESIGNNSLLLDVSMLEEGLHTINIALQSDELSVTSSYMFVKVAMMGMDSIDLNHLTYHCWFDQDIAHQQTDLLGDGHILLDVEGLSDGLHVVNVMLEGSVMNVPKSYLFYKRPVGGAIVKWEYWLNDAFNNRYITNLSPGVDTMDIITLLPVETHPVRSVCFHFHPNGDTPYLNAKNEIKFRFWDAEHHFTELSSFYVDEQVEQSIEATVFERNTTVTIPAPNNNQIRWYKLEAGRGERVSFRSNKVCSMQLFSLSGEEIYSVSGLESIQEGGCYIEEDGVYYLAVHDVIGSSETVSVTYNWLNRYAIVSYDVHLVGNGGCSTITFQGNGFNSLLDAYLVNWQNDTIRSLDIGHESNTTTTVSLNFYQENLGAYDAVFEFFEETIRINGALEVQEPVDILLTSTVSYPSVFLRNTPCTYTYTVTNNGNMSAYVVPIFVYIDSPTKDGISHIEFDGLDLPSLMDYFDLDSLSFTEIEELALFSLEEGEGHCFFMFPSIDENTGDSTFIRSNYFFMNLAPFETKTLTLKITADVPIEAWVAFPSDTIFPLTFLSNRDISGHYCCAQDFISCNLDVICSYIDLIELVVSVIPGLPYKVVASIASCICDVISLMNTQLSLLLCEGDEPSGFWDMLKRINYSSMIGAAASCFTKKLLKGFSLNLYKILNLIQRLKTLLLSGVNASFDCSTLSMSSPNCPPDPPKGGKSNPVYSFDPNDIYGYLSESGSHYMRQEIQNVQYEIEFENDTTLATAAAHTIIVRDTLDATKFDLNSLAARSVTIGDKRLDLNGEQTFARTLDLRPENYVIAQVNQDYDPATGIIQWTVQSLDPMTMEPTDDPNQGVLPVNYYGDGVGFIDYSIDIKEAFADGTEISNRAGIIFDQNDVIITPTWTNIVDAVKPTSHIEEVTPIEDSLSFSFVSEDNRSGVWYHTLYYRNDSTQMEWQVKKPQITANSLILYFDDFQTTEYLVMATDSAGNHEEKEMVAEYIYYYEGPGPATQTDDLSAGWNWWSTYIEMNGANGQELLENGLGTNGRNIKSDNGNSVEYIPDWEMWWGDEIEVRNESMYEINVAQAGTVTVAGTQAIPGAHPITLAPGWNWIGYPVNASLPTETALASLSPTEEDVIQSRNGYSMYWPDFGFWGDVEYMTPGSGYKYMSNNAQPQTLTYPSSRGKALAYKPKTVETRPEAMQHQYLMDIVAVAELEGEELNAGHYELIALSDGQVRGRASLRYCEPNGRHVAMLLVYGDASETLEFRLLDTESGRLYEAAERMDFKADKVVGGLRKPFTMHFGSEQEDAFALESMFPNPAKTGETVYVNMVDTSIEASVSDIELFNTLGERIPVGHMKGSPLSFQAPKAAGVYMVRLTSHGEVYHGTLIVTQ